MAGRGVSASMRAGVHLTWLCALLAGGCSDDPTAAPIDPANTPVTIRFLRHDNPNYRVADNQFFAEYMAAHPTVKIEDSTVNFMTLAATLNGELKNDRFPYDLVLIPPGWTCGYAANLTDVPAEVTTLPEAQNTFFAAPLAGSSCGGRLKGLPVEYNLEYGGVVVNVDKYMAKFNRPPSWTDWNQFIDEAAMLGEYDDAGNPMANGLDIAPDWPPPVMSLLFSQVLQRGGNFRDANGLFDFKTTEARDSLAAMVGWVATKRVMHRKLIPERNTDVTTRLAVGATGFGWSDPTKPLSIMGYVGTWGVPSTVRQLPPGITWHFEYFPHPPIVGTQHRFVSDSGWAFAVPNTSRNPRIAWDVARSLAMSPAAMRRWSAITGALPALRSNGSPAAAASDPTLAKVQPLLEHGQWIGHTPPDAIVASFFGIVNNFFEAVAGTKTVDEALAQMEQTANAAIMQSR